MGVVHKLKPEVRDFILEQKQENNLLSCRKLTSLILEKFQTKVSKSSINIIIKEAGLSAPIGRTPKKRKQRIAMPVLPVLLEDALVKEAQVKAQKEAERKAKEEVEALKLAQEEELRRVEIEAKKAIEEEAKKTEEERWARIAEVERLAKESQEKAQVEAQVKAQEEAEKKAKLEAEERVKLEALQREKEETERKAKERAEALRLAEAAQEKERLEEEARKQQVERLAQEARRIVEEAEKLKQEAAKITPTADIFNSKQIENTGIILLKAADSIIGGMQSIVTVFKDRLGKSREVFSPIVENLIFLPLIQEKLEKPVLDKLFYHLEDFENVKVLGSDISRAIDFLLQDVRCVKVTLSDGSSLYLDGQMYSAWSSPHIPYDFASPISTLRSNMDKFINAEYPIVLFNAPGYDMPSQEFFNLLSGLATQVNTITNLTYYGNKLEELDALSVTLAQESSLIFGLWPWQFSTCRKVNKIGEFKKCHIQRQNKDVYVADIDLELIHFGLSKQLPLSGCALKTNLNEKTRLVILSNSSPSAKSSEELANIYLNRWPNLDEAFQDYSRKIELFTYTANSQRFFSIEKIGIKLSNSLKIKDLFNNYLIALDAYVRWCLLPPGFEDKPLQETYERFYKLDVQLNKTGEGCLAKFILAQDYAFGKDLTYLCRRINEKEASLSSGEKLYFNLE